MSIPETCSVASRRCSSRLRDSSGRGWGRSTCSPSAITGDSPRNYSPQAQVHPLHPARFSRPWTILEARQRPRRVLTSVRPDAVICQACWPHALFGPVGRRANLPLACWLHDVAKGDHWIERRAMRARRQIWRSCAASSTPRAPPGSSPRCPSAWSIHRFRRPRGLTGPRPAWRSVANWRRPRTRSSSSTSAGWNL